MSEKTIYQDRAVTITNRKIMSEQGEYSLVEFFALDIKQLKAEAKMWQAFFRTIMYVLPVFFLTLCVTAVINSTLLSFLMFITMCGIMWWNFDIERIWPHVIYADTRRGEKLIFKGYGKRYTEKIARIIAETSGCVPAPKKIIY